MFIFFQFEKIYKKPCFKRGNTCVFEICTKSKKHELVFILTRTVHNKKYSDRRFGSRIGLNSEIERYICLNFLYSFSKWICKNIHPMKGCSSLKWQEKVNFGKRIKMWLSINSTLTVRVRVETSSSFFNLQSSAKYLDFKGDIYIFLEFMQNQQNMNSSLSWHVL